MLVQKQVGPVVATSSLAAGAAVNGRLGNMGEDIVSELHARYYETTYRRAVYTAASQAATATSVALATTYTGLCLSNPQGSTVNLVLTKVGIGLSVAPAGIATIGLLSGYLAAGVTAHTTALGVRSQFVGVGASGQGLADAACTLVGTPVVNQILMGGFTAAALPSVGPSLIDIEGSIILPPGAYCGIYTLTSVTGLFSMTWEEVPV